MQLLCQANSYSAPQCLLKLAELPIRFWRWVIPTITVQHKSKGSKPHAEFCRKLLNIVSNKRTSLDRIKTKPLDTRLSSAGFNCLPQYPPHFRGLELLNGMGSLAGIYLVWYFITFTFVLSFWIKNLSTIMSNQGHDRPDHPTSSCFEIEIWEIFLWSLRPIENQATWLRSQAPGYQLTSHVPSLTQVVWGVHHIGAG